MIPRVAFLTDCFHEVNGVALTSRQLDQFARQRQYPFFSLHIGAKNRVWTEGSVTTMELRRSGGLMRLDADMFFDFAFNRHLGFVRGELTKFRPDLVHITGPGDCGILGAIVAKQLGVPLVSSWHTDLHKYAGRRLAQTLWFLPKSWKANLDDVAERNALRALRWFYGLAKVTLAPNPDLVSMLEEATGKPCFLMRRGIDTSVFFPARRDRAIDDGTLVLGYVGRLSPEKGIGLLAPLEQAIRAAGITNYKFLIVGQGAEREALAASLKNVEFTGVLKGEALARAYANMDLFVFPSRTDTFGNVIQEALASGVPAVVFAEGGPKFLVDPGTTGLRAESEEEFCQAVLSLMRDRERRLFMAQTLRESTLDRRWESVFEEVYEAYRQSLKPRPAPARFSSQPA